jgi:hypothetical protein
MVIIHRTTLSPEKLALLAARLPAQPWYHHCGRGAGAGDTADGALQPCLWAPWRLPDGPPARGVLASAQYRPHPAATA